MESNYSSFISKGKARTIQVPFLQDFPFPAFRQGEEVFSSLTKYSEFCSRTLLTGFRILNAILSSKYHSPPTCLSVESFHVIRKEENMVTRYDRNLFLEVRVQHKQTSCLYCWTSEVVQ